MSVLLHAAVKGEVRRLETVLVAATDPDDIALLRCAIADLISCAAAIRGRLNDEWAINHPRWAQERSS